MKNDLDGERTGGPARDDRDSAPLAPGQRKQLDPQIVVCVCTNMNGLEVGRIPAAARNAEAYVKALVRKHGSITVEYVEDAAFCEAHRKPARTRAEDLPDSDAPFPGLVKDRKEMK